MSDELFIEDSELGFIVPDEGGTLLLQVLLARKYYGSGPNEVACSSEPGQAPYITVTLGDEKYRTKEGIDITGQSQDGQEGRTRRGSVEKHSQVFEFKHELLFPYDQNNNFITVAVERFSNEAAGRRQGRFVINLTQANSWGLKWYEVKVKNEIAGEVLIACFPTLPKTPLAQAPDSNQASFWEFRKKKTQKTYKAVKQFVEKFIQDHILVHYVLAKDEGAFPSADPAQIEDYLALLDMMKQEKGRLLFQETLSKLTGNKPKLLLADAFQSLADVMKASLREANNNGDFHACKVFLDLSYLFHKLIRDRGDSDFFLYSHLKEHEVFRNIAFWEGVFLEAYTLERQKLFDEEQAIASLGPPSVDGSETSHIKRATHQQQENKKIESLLILSVMQMLNTNLESQTIRDFLSNMGQTYNVSQGLQSTLAHLITQTESMLQNPLKHEVPRMSKLSTSSTPSGRVGRLLSTIQARPFETPRASQTSIESKSIAEDEPERELEKQGCWIKYTIHKNVSYFHNIDTNEVSFEPPAEWVDSDTTTKEDAKGVHVTVKPTFLLGEVQVSMLRDVELLTLVSVVKGTLFLTNYRVCFRAYDRAFNNQDMVDVLSTASVHALHRTEIRDDILYMYIKDLRLLRVRVPDQAQAESLVDKLHKYAFRGQDSSFAYSFRNPVTPSQDGWNVYHVRQEFTRQGVFAKDYWRITEINKQFEYAPTYTPQIIVPADVPDDLLVKAKKFRSKGRIPTLCYHYRNTGAVMLRSSQPMVGFGKRRSVEDEKLLELARVREILDCRPKANAVANQAKGGGYENVSHYQSLECDVKFLGIDNIHVMRDSLNKLEALCRDASVRRDANDQWFSELDSTGWLRHVRGVLSSSMHTAELMDQFTSVLVHCSDGWDRTAQICSLTQLLLDPYYRTIRGFAVLIEKEWCSYGHKFADRTGHCDKNHGSHERSPIFLQFLDCVWQIVSQFPSAFEFLPEYLSWLADQLYQCKYGTFLYNNVMEREVHHVRSRTVSIWTDALRAKHFLNPFFEPKDGLLVFNCDWRNIRLWPYYYRSDETLHAREDSDRTARRLVTLERDCSFAQRRWLESKLRAVEEAHSTTVDEWKHYADSLLSIIADKLGSTSVDVPTAPSIDRCLSNESWQDELLRIPAPAAPPPLPPARSPTYEDSYDFSGAERRDPSASTDMRTSISRLAAAGAYNHTHSTKKRGSVIQSPHLPPPPVVPPVKTEFEAGALTPPDSPATQASLRSHETGSVSVGSDLSTRSARPSAVNRPMLMKKARHSIMKAKTNLVGSGEEEVVKAASPVRIQTLKPRDSPRSSPDVPRRTPPPLPADAHVRAAPAPEHTMSVPQHKPKQESIDVKKLPPPPPPPLPPSHPPPSH